MKHAIVVPILLPFAAAILCALGHGLGLRAQRLISIGASLAMLPVAGYLVALSGNDTIGVYALGDWPAPFGIVLVLDRLAATMVLLSATLAFPALLYATAGDDGAGSHFHALFQLQIMGLNGAFLTGDLFNLFVFFEILLLASYALLAHGNLLPRIRAGIAYVVLNLAGSTLFLVALGLLYGTLGTLNMADIGRALAQVPPTDQALTRTACALLVSVFVLKAALLPMSFWLPHAYGAAVAPVAALFAIMTKVGIYSLLRMTAIGFSASHHTADILQPWLMPLAVATVATGTFGALASTRLAVLVANLVVVSTGTMLAAFAVPGLTEDAIAAALYYMIHSTLVSGAFFLLAGRIAAERGDLADNLVRGPALGNAVPLGVAYFVTAIAICGAPPLSGFIGKLMVMQAVPPVGVGAAVWIALLASSLLAALVLAWGANVYFWEPGRADAAATRAPAGRREAAWGLLMACGIALTVQAAAFSAYTRATAAQLRNPERYISAVLAAAGTIHRERRP